MGAPDRAGLERESALQASINSQTLTPGGSQPQRRRLGPIGKEVIGQINNRNASNIVSQNQGAD